MDFVFTEQRERCRAEWPIPGHRRRVDRSLVGEPVEEALEGEVAVAGGVRRQRATWSAMNASTCSPRTAQGSPGMPRLARNRPSDSTASPFVRRVLAARFSASGERRNEVELGGETGRYQALGPGREGGRGTHSPVFERCGNPARAPNRPF